MPLNTDINGPVAELVFDHPPVNAFPGSMWLELSELITELGPPPRTSLHPHPRGRQGLLRRSGYQRTGCRL